MFENADRPLSRRTVCRAGLMLAAGAGSGLLSACGAEAAPQSQFVLLDGRHFSTQDMLGKVTLVNFWATSCTTCVAEMPEIVRTHEKYQSRGYQTLAVAMSYDPPAYVIRFAESRKLPFAVALDNTGAAAKAWGDVQLTPTTYLVNQRAQIVKRYVGAPDFAALHQLIDKLLTQA